MNGAAPRAAWSTLEALAYELRAGPGALRDALTRRRLAELSELQMRDIAGRLTKQRWSNGKAPKRVGPWQPDCIKMVIEMWRKHHG
jgi:hypothetical protein